MARALPIFTVSCLLPQRALKGPTLRAGVIVSGNKLYGATQGGGSGSQGTFFQLNTDGSGFTNLYDFVYSVGAQPQSAPVLSGNSLYGVTTQGGSTGSGIVFGLTLFPPPVPLNISSINNTVVLNWNAPDAFLVCRAHPDQRFHKNNRRHQSLYQDSTSSPQKFFRLQ